jgi:hypothetical protein
MEEVRSLGVAAMQQAWATRNDNLRLAVSAWPPYMSKKDFRIKVQELINSPDNLRRKSLTADSMINRLRNNHFFKFCKDTKTWVNHTSRGTKAHPE